MACPAVPSSRALRERPGADGGAGGLARAPVRLARVLPSVVGAGGVGHRRLAGLLGHHPAGGRHRRARGGRRRRGHQPGDGGPHRPRVLLRAPRRRARRPVGSQEGDDRLRPRTGRGRSCASRSSTTWSAWSLASLVLEVLTLLWSPAKEAIVPNLVPPDHLTTANSLSLAAAYGTFPFASLLFALLAGVSAWLGHDRRPRLPRPRPDGARVLRRRRHLRGRRRCWCGPW